jgi:hypothetical protein
MIMMITIIEAMGIEEEAVIMAQAEATEEVAIMTQAEDTEEASMDTAGDMTARVPTSMTSFFSDQNGFIALDGWNGCGSRWWLKGRGESDENG